jgi:antitoxin VapB
VGKNVYIQKIEDAIILVPFDKAWETFLHGLNSFSDDFMSEGRLQELEQEREEL